MAAHRYAEFIKAWADGEEIEVATMSGWQPIGKSPSWSEGNEYRVKSRHEYPISQLSDDDLRAAVTSVPPIANIVVAWRAVANKALRRAIDNGQVVAHKEHEAKVKEAVDHGVDIIRRMARDMATSQRGPDGWPLSEREIQAIEQGILERHMGCKGVQP